MMVRYTVVMTAYTMHHGFHSSRRSQQHACQGIIPADIQKYDGSQVISNYSVHQPTSSGLTWVTLVTGGERPHVLIKHLQTVYL